MCTEQRVSVGEPFARRVDLECVNYRVRLKSVLVEQNSEVRVAGVRRELIGDVRNMITGFLKDNRMKLPAGCGNNIGRISARRAWIPLKKGKAELMMHEIAVGCVNVTKPVRFGLPKFDHGKNQCLWFWEKDLFLYEDQNQQDCGFPQGRY